MTIPLLQIEDLSIAYETDAGIVHAVREVSFSVNCGEVFGLVGESGCGKSTLAYAMLGDLGDGGHRRTGHMLFRGRDLLSLPGRDLERLRGSQIAMVHQNPGAALTPSMKIGAQLTEVLRVHRAMSEREARQRCLALLDRVHLPDAAKLMDRYPHELSGGQQQRVVIAMALLAEPDLLVLDEPTTGLDVTVEAAVLDLLLEIKSDSGVAIVYIAHNLGAIARVCDRVGVMYAGELVELAAAADLFRHPRHPYTASLLRCVPRVDRATERHSLAPIPGTVPSPYETPSGCSFADRCRYARQPCRETRPAPDYSPQGRLVRCLRWRELDQNDNSASIISPRRVGTRPPQPDAVLVAEDLRVYYPVGRRRGLEHDSYLKAVDGVTLTVRQGCITAIVGESGCGKSSLGAAIVGLRTLSAGRLTFDDRDISRPVRQRPSVVHRLLQMVFQDHSATLNPSVSIGRIIGRPLRLFSTVPAKEVGAEVRRLLKAVGLDESINRRKPAQLSGGQRQRVAIARAFAGRPHLVVCDEITSALDVSVQASVLNFLLDLQRSSQTSLIFISHDLGVVRYIADEVIVMYLGRVCESGPADDVFAGPNHPYTEALLSAVPIPDPEAAVVRVRLQGPIPSPLAPPQGCPFHTRCHRKLEGLCETETPPLRDLGADHRVWCHLPLGSSETERESLRRGRALMAR